MISKFIIIGYVGGGRIIYSKAMLIMLLIDYHVWGLSLSSQEMSKAKH